LSAEINRQDKAQSMKTKIKYLLILVLASFVFAGCCTTHGRKTTQWEYKTVKLLPYSQDFEASLNETGKAGWKLLTAVAGVGDSGYVYYTFERPKQ
jgi:hypothetical protein